ncbi:hypothetical protein ES703_89035 [subsurface metagenome]
MPITEILNPLFFIALVSSSAPRSVPSPPMVNNKPIPSFSKLSTISSTSCGPREDDKMSPPLRWISFTNSGVNGRGFCGAFEDNPAYPYRKPRTFLTPYCHIRLRVMVRITSLRPGHNPPQVTMPQFSFLGSKKILRRAPALSNIGSCLSEFSYSFRFSECEYKRIFS